jgi:hypothetical protein
VVNGSICTEVAELASIGCRVRCAVFRYDIGTRAAVPGSAISEASNYAAAVSRDGTVYLARRFSLACATRSDVQLTISPPPERS